MTTETITLTAPKGKRLIANAPTNTIAVANTTEGDNSPCPMDVVEDELYHLRLILGRMNIQTRVISQAVTEFCTMNFVVLKETSLDKHIRAKDVAFEFCKRADYLYTL